MYEKQAGEAVPLSHLSVRQCPMLCDVYLATTIFKIFNSGPYVLLNSMIGKRLKGRRFDIFRFKCYWKAGVYFSVNYVPTPLIH